MFVDVLHTFNQMRYRRYPVCQRVTGSKERTTSDSTKNAWYSAEWCGKKLRVVLAWSKIDVRYMSAKWWQSGTGFITNPNNTLSLLMGNPSNLPYICIHLIPPNRLFNDPLWFSPSLYPKIALRLVLSAMDCCEADRAIESKSNIYVEKKRVNLPSGS